MKSSLFSDDSDNAARPDIPARGPIGEFMVSEHALLDTLLAQAVRGSVEAYQGFRQRLLRHIRIEERLLLPTAEQKRSGEPLPLAARLRLDHGVLAALMMLPPTRSTFRTVSAVLKAHNPLEETSGGVYDQCEALAGPDASELLSQCEKTPPVPVSPWIDDPKVFEAARRALIRAGYAASLLDEDEVK
jgi:hypothetical protein